MQLVVESLNLFVVSSSWDAQFLHCLAESSRQKIATVSVKDMRSGTLVSKTGKFYYDTLKVCQVYQALLLEWFTIWQTC